MNAEFQGNGDLASTGGARRAPAPGAESGVRALAGRLLSRVPGGAFVQEQLEAIERRLLLELKQRMDGVGQPAQVSVLAVSVQTASGPAQIREPGQMLQNLLAATAEQSREQAEASFYCAILAAMVPDEARILSALSDGSGYPLISVMAAPRLGLAWHPVLEGVSSVGRSAGVLCPDMTYAYVQRLRGWSLVESGPEDYTQTTRYEMLETEQVVRGALDQIKKSGQRGQVARRMLKMSDLGMRLWAACRISRD
jgi:hypothetical protein